MYGALIFSKAHLQSMHVQVEDLSNIYDVSNIHDLKEAPALQNIPNIRALTMLPIMYVANI
ncbi:hypothetical protein N7466_002705 [Penicillium verhagenii]|uniref:uncharacterized protein n=1 Tax=Penicillium verhagenii TaxID=1562060 RepID=UPI0025452DE3|nr:uncharacterized protein N7466_002705 [Penicillium verhagenii]KAJ5939571.1 hypothetical protein N7466_002705 [Penicillium verhagenii]